MPPAPTPEPPERRQFNPVGEPPSAPRRPPPAGPRPSFDDVEFGDDLDYDEVVGRRRSEPGTRGGILGRRRPAPSAARKEDDNGRDKPPEQDAFVIRPRISAKQASEYSFTDDRPR